MPRGISFAPLTHDENRRRSFRKSSKKFEKSARRISPMRRRKKILFGQHSHWGTVVTGRISVFCEHAVLGSNSRRTAGPAVLFKIASKSALSRKSKSAKILRFPRSESPPILFPPNSKLVGFTVHGEHFPRTKNALYTKAKIPEKIRLPNMPGGGSHHIPTRGHGHL
jgi:hypothetical protein